MKSITLNLSLNEICYLLETLMAEAQRIEIHSERNLEDIKALKESISVQLGQSRPEKYNETELRN